MTLFKNFLADEDGAVTVDWVVLTAGVVVLGAVVATLIQPAVDTEVANIAAGIVTP